MAQATKQANQAQGAEAFDYVIVGAGSSGAVLANRLSADSSVSVLLLEAGPADKNTKIAIPAAFSQLFKTDFDWNYQTAPQPALRNRSIYWPRGKVLGGSSSLNAMMWVQGFAADYERWGELAGAEWGWNSVAPLLTSTQVSVEPQRDPSPYTAAFLQAAQQAGHAVEAANRDEPAGFTQTLVTQKDGARHNTAKAYLDSVRGRPNLTIRTGAQATRVLFDDETGQNDGRTATGRTATGIEYLSGGSLHTAQARREVVLAGGAINTPQLLMLSGIGDPAHLQEHGIDVRVASPEVGKNLRDHLVSGLVMGVKQGTLKDATRLSQVFKYLTKRRGMLTSNVAEAYGFVRTDPGLALPDIEIIFAPVAYVDEGLKGIPAHGLTVGSILLQPESRGQIRLASKDPIAKAIVDPRYLSDALGKDRKALLRGLAIAQSIFDAPALREQLTGGYVAPSGTDDWSAEDRNVESLEQYSHTLYHPTSTARMGKDEASVVDPELRVRGIHRLRVADASVFPEIIRGHTHAPAVMVGECAAALMLAAAR